MKNLGKVGALLIVLMFMLSGCGSSQPTDQQKPASNQKETSNQKEITLRFPGTMPVDHHITKGQEMFKKIVEERTGGKIKVTVFPAQQLYKDKELVDVVPQGAVEMAAPNFGMWTGLVPELSVLNMHLLFDSKEHFYKAQDDKEITKIIDESLQKKANTKLISWLDYGQNGPITTREIKSLADLKGMKMRGDSELATIFLKTLGAAPTLLSSSEVYQALEKGVVDGAISGPTTLTSRKWFEVAKYPVDNFINESLFGIVMNLDTWNSLSSEQQTILLEAGKEVSDWTREASQKEEQKAWDELKAKPGIKVLTISNEEIEKWRPLVIETESKVIIDKIGKEKYEQLVNLVNKLK